MAYGTLPLIGRVLNGRSAAQALLEPLRRFTPDLVLAYWLYPDAYGASAVAHRLGIPVVSGARGSDLRARDRLSLILTRRALDRSAGVLAVSDNLRSIAIDRFGVPGDRATTIANGCDSRIFRLAGRVDARAQLGLPNEMRLVLFAGRLVEAKGVRELLSAWSAIAAEDPDRAPGLHRRRRVASRAGGNGRVAGFRGPRASARCATTGARRGVDASLRRLLPAEPYRGLPERTRRGAGMRPAGRGHSGRRSGRDRR